MRKKAREIKRERGGEREKVSEQARKNCTRTNGGNRKVAAQVNLSISYEMSYYKSLLAHAHTHIHTACLFT